MSLILFSVQIQLNHTLIKSITSIFQLNAHYIKYIYLPNTSYVFWCVFHHPGQEHCVTWSKTACLYKVVTHVVLQNLKYTFCKIYSHIEMNYKRSGRLKFSRGFIQKKMMVYRSTFRQVLLSPSSVAQIKCSPISPEDIRKTGIDC